MYCICCKNNNVSPISEQISEEELLWRREIIKDGSILTINNEMINNGIIHIVDGGFGSRNDGNRLIIAICDDCIDRNLNDGTILYFDNYMITNSSISEVTDLIDKSKQAYRRRKNLDNLTHD